MRLLVTGGAGYIGSHMVHVLVAAGHHVVVIDDLSAGHREAVSPKATLVQADVRDRDAVGRALREHAVDAVLHFASRIQVGESVTNPRRYYRDNLVAAVDLLDTVLDAGVRHFILSSTAAVYGDPIRTPIDEAHPTQPVNPYGATKLAVERMLADYERAYGLSWAAPRYFNASGAAPSLGLGERHEPETHLIPLVVGAALGKRPPLTVFGTDYPTPDGTCVRDYVHVLDLADAHLLALEHLRAGRPGGAFNLGSGSGHSVREVIAAVEKRTGKTVPVTFGARRAGDPAVLVASSARAERELGWKKTRSSLEHIVDDAVAFEMAAGA